METLVTDDVVTAAEAVQRVTRTVFGVDQVGRNIDVPIGERVADGLEPRRNACFSGMDLLPTTDQSDHRRAVLVPMQVGDEEGGLGELEV